MSAPAPAARRAALRYRFQLLNAWMEHNLTADLSVTALANRALMAPRSFARSYREIMGITPAQAVEKLRIAAATRLLGELSSSPVSTLRVGHLVGFDCAESFRRAFIRQRGMSPDQWLELDATTSPGGRRMTEDMEKALLETVDSTHKKVTCLQTHMDQQFAALTMNLREQLDRIERQVGGNPPATLPPGEDTAHPTPPYEPPVEASDAKAERT